MNIDHLLRQAASGAAAAGEAVYVDDVFSTYLYEGTGGARFIENGIDLGRAPVRLIESVNHGAVDKTVTVAASTKLVVFALNTSNSVLGCSVNGSSLSTAVDLSSNAHNYRTVVYVSTLSEGSNRIQVDDNGLGHTEVFLIDSNATVSVSSSGNWATSATSVSPPSFTSNGFGLVLLSDRDPNSNFSSSGSNDPVFYEKSHTYFRFEAIGIPGSGSQVPQRTFSGLTNNYAGKYVVLNITGVGTNPVANSAASGEGGMVWIKSRSVALDHYLFDTERGATKRLITNRTNAETTAATSLTSFNSNGFSLGSLSQVNNIGYDFASWTFRKQPGFFDVVTYTGNSTAGHTIPHNLGTVPGMIIIKWVNTAGDWSVYHRSTGNETIMRLNSTAATSGNSISYFNNTDPTSTEFTLGSGTDMNLNGYDYVAYLFAHDAQDFGTDSDESIIKCGTIAANSSETLGFEPQWLLTKKYDGSAGWTLVDSMRRFEVDGSNYVQADTTGSEATNGLWKINSNGFSLGGGSGNYIYMAIRRPHKPASEFAATDLFHVETMVNSSSSEDRTVDTGFNVDSLLLKVYDTSSQWYWADRLRGTGNLLRTDSVAAEDVNTNNWFKWDTSEAISEDLISWNSDRIYYNFRRAPGFFDVVAYTGTGTAGLSINHNLGVTPEMMIVKRRNSSQGWAVYHQYANASPATGACQLESTIAFSASAVYWNDTAPTDTVFTLGSSNITNNNNDTYIAYLFASVPGISKVGSYTGTGSDVDVNCGFTSGARFVLVKRTDSTGDWYVWDSERGIVAGNDPYMLLNTTAAEVTSTDYIDPLSSGFTITSSAPAALNTSGGTYIFLAIA